jgi:ribosome-binding protein aMBF1 (putative translation factor)
MSQVTECVVCKTTIRSQHEICKYDGNSMPVCWKCSGMNPNDFLTKQQRRSYKKTVRTVSFSDRMKRLTYKNLN